MTFIAVPPYLFPPVLATQWLSSSNILMDAAGEKAGWLLTAPKTGNIRKVRVLFGSVTTPTDTDLRLETIDLATGFPSGTLWGTNTNVTIPSASITSGANVESTLTADAAVVKGDQFAVLVAPTGTPNFNLVIAKGSGQGVVGSHFLQFLSGAWSRGILGGMQVLLEYDDGSVAPMINTAPLSQGVTTPAFANGSSPDERGNRFSLPYGVRVAGIWYVQNGAPGSDFDLILYHAGGSNTVTQDKEIASSLSTGIRYFNTAVELAANSVNRVAIRPAGASTITIHVLTVALNAHLEQFLGTTEWYETTRTDAGAWTDDDNEVTACGIIIEAIDVSPVANAAIPIVGSQGPSIQRVIRARGY